MSLVSVSIFFFKQKTAYEMRISDWSSDVCSSDLRCFEQRRIHIDAANAATGCDIQEQVAGSLVIQSQSPGGIVALGLHDARAVRQVQRGSSVAFVDGPDRQSVV